MIFPEKIELETYKLLEDLKTPEILIYFLNYQWLCGMRCNYLF